MRNSKVSLCAILMCALPLAAQTESERPASVEGTVTDSVSGLPVPRAHVTLQGGSNGRPLRYGTTSAADGKFSITGIQPGNYWAEAQRVGFDGSSEPRARAAVILKGDDRKTGLEIHLTPTGSITGRVTDSNGEPVEGAGVSAEGGRGGSSGITDESGRFRIGGLAPGRYSVRADHDETFGGRPEIRTDGTVEVHNATTYYPGALTEKEAGKVAVQAGGESTGIDIRLVRVPFVRVSGRVVDMPPKAEEVFLEVSQGNGGTGTELAPDGSFETWRLNPGKYTISAEWNAPNGERVHTVGAQIEVAGLNIDNIELRVVPDSEIPGRLDFEDDEAKQLFAKAGRLGQMVMLVAMEEYNNVESSAPVDAEGTFHLEKVPAGKYRVRVEAGATYIKSMRLGGAAIDGAVLDLSRGSAGADLSLFLSAATGSVSGTVQDDRGPAAGLTVVLVAADAETGSDPRYTGIGPDGTYAFANVPPGSYKLAAVPEQDLAVQGNNVLGYEDLMVTVEVGSQEKVTKDLKRRTPAVQ